jgi:hypothetical protein
VHLSLVESQVDTAEDLGAFHFDMEVLDLEQRGIHDHHPITTTAVVEI